MIDNIKDVTKKVTDSPFFTFSRPPLEFFEKGKLFKLVFLGVCILAAVLTLIHPFVILCKMISSGYFNFGVKYTLAFIFVWLGILAACWFGFHLWWDKRKKAAEFASSEFVALPFSAELVKTFGEWFGMLVAVIGFVGGLFALIFLGGYGGGMLSATLGVNLVGSEGGLLSLLPEMLSGPLSAIYYGLVNIVFDLAVILGPIAGFLIIYISRFISEKLRVLVTIADNTKK